MMRITKCILPILVVLLIQSCGKVEKFIPDFSTPEATLQTYHYATRHQLHEIVLESLSEDLRNKYGTDKASQLQIIRKSLRPNMLDTEVRLEIVAVRPLNQDGNNVEVIFNKLKDDEVIFRNGRVPMIKEKNQWKVALVREPEPTFEQIAQAEEVKKIIKTGVVLDEERNVWVPADEASQKK